MILTSTAIFKLRSPADRFQGKWILKIVNKHGSFRVKRVNWSSLQFCLAHDKEISTALSVWSIFSSFLYIKDAGKCEITDFVFPAKKLVLEVLVYVTPSVSLGINNHAHVISDEHNS